jgi:hypothetical protein
MEVFAYVRVPSRSRRTDYARNKEVTGGPLRRPEMLEAERPIPLPKGHAAGAGHWRSRPLVARVDRCVPAQRPCFFPTHSSVRRHATLENTLATLDKHIATQASQSFARAGDTTSAA